MEHEPKRIVLAATISLLWSITAWSRAFNTSHELAVTLFIFMMIIVTAALVYIFIFRILIEIFCNYLQERKDKGRKHNE